MISEALLTLPQMLSSMDIALADEIKAQSKKSGSHIAVNGTLTADLNGQYLYSFTLNDPWEPQDDTPFKIKVSGTQEIKGTIVNSTGTTITIATEQPLPPEALHQISLVDDPTQLLERLRDALKSNDEGTSQLGSKSFGLLSFTSSKRPAPIEFGTNFQPDSSQERAIRLALGSEVTYIVGPPGTGKTATLAAIAFAHLLEGHTVLIAAHTNIAVDNAIMRLVDICRDTHTLDQLREGSIIRYGTAHLEELLKSKYSEVHLPTIVRQRVGGLNQRRKELQTDLDKLTEYLTRVNQENTYFVEQWQAERQRLIAQHEVYKSELLSLQAREQQRIATLDSQLQNLFHQLTDAQQRANAIRQKLAQVAAQQVEQHTARSKHLAQVNNLTAKLAAAQQMNPMTRFFKGINRKSLAQQLADSQQKVWYCDQNLAGLQKQMNDLHSARATAEQRVEQLISLHRNATAQRNTPSTDGEKIRQLQTASASCNQEITQGDTRLSQARDSIEKKHSALKSEQERIREQVAVIDKQLAETEKHIVAEASVVATTLCKTYMNANLRERRFDVVILDEVSMAPLPAVYVAASRADSSVVAIGDPRQLAPICEAKDTSTAAKDWLSRDLFELRNISLEDANREYGNSTLLKYQARMHPDISYIARKHVYRELLQDRRKDIEANYSEVRPLPGKPLLLCDTGDASPVSMKPDGGSRINVYHALCTIEIARQVLVSLPSPKRQLQKGEFRVGLVTPYAKQAELLQRLILDAGLKDYIRAGTVHRFQGLEAEVIIFDTVESHPLVPKFTSGQFGSEAMRLINVAVTRAQHKLIIVANSQYIQAKFDEKDILRLAVQEAQKIGTIKSRDVLRIASPPLADVVHSSLPGYDHQTSVDKNTPTYESEFLDDRTFYKRFLEDVHSAKQQIVIFSPFLSPQRTRQIGRSFEEKRKEKVRITVFASLSQDKDETTGEAGTLLKEAGVQLRPLSGMHEKLVFIDEEIVYTGSLNVLSHGGTTEFMERVKSPSFARKLRQLWNVDTLVETPTKWGPGIEVFRRELPESRCKECGKTLIPRPGKYGVFYGCTGYPKCIYTEDVSEDHLSNLQRLKDIRCRDCGEPMQVKTHRKNAWLICSASTPCNYGHHIIIKPD